MILKREILIIVTCYLGLSILSPSAFAHKVNIFAYTEGDTVYTESYFPDGKKVKGGRIEVYDSQGKKLLEGVTDEKGQFNFKLPKIDKLKIIINASMGHRNSCTLTMEKPAKLKEKKIPLRDIISGIGYIFGIAGIIFYFLSKKRNN